MYYLMVSVGVGLEARLNLVVLVQGLSGGGCQVVTRACRHLGVVGLLPSSLPGLRFLSGCWLDTSPHGPLHWLPEGPPVMAAGFHESDDLRGRPRQEQQSFLVPSET